MRDEYYNRHIMDKRLIDPVLDLLNRCLPRDNLLCSACLEFFDFFAKEDLGDLTKHLVSTYSDKLKALDYLPTFKDLVTGKYPQPGSIIQQQAILGSNGHLTSHQLGSSGDGGAAGPRSVNGGHTSLLDSIAMDPEEEAYWNGEDDEELQNSLGSPDDDQTNGESSVLKQLVDYPSDDDEEDMEATDPADLDVAKASSEVLDDESQESAVLSDEEDDDVLSVGLGSGTDSENIAPHASPVRASVSASSRLGGRPPERLSEKRRREEDEEDEISKMMVQNKRRNSRSTTANTALAPILQKAGVNGVGKTVSNKSSSNGNSSDSGSDNGYELGSGAAESPVRKSTPAKKISINITSKTLQAVAADSTGPGIGDDAM